MQIENSITLDKWSQLLDITTGKQIVMLNSYPRDRIFNPLLTAIEDYYILPFQGGFWKLHRLYKKILHLD